MGSITGGFVNGASGYAQAKAQQEAYQQHAFQQQQQERAFQRAEAYRASASGHDSEQSRPIPLRAGGMNEARARELLGYGGPLGDKPGVSAAFSKAVKAAHPDAGGTGGDIAALKEAREYLLSCNIATKKPCPICKGVGIVATQAFAGMQCQSCKGTGIKP